MDMYNFMEKKRFYLLGPDQYDKLYLHPHVHPYDKQSQVNFSHPHGILDPLPEEQSSQFPLWANHNQYVVDLKPGEMLSLPPYWFHHVVAIEVSISVNAWCPSPSFQADMQLRSLPKLVEGNVRWPPKTRSLALKVFLDDLVKATQMPGIIEEIIVQRYEPFQRHQGPTPYIRDASCKFYQCQIEGLFMDNEKEEMISQWDFCLLNQKQFNERKDVKAAQSRFKPLVSAVTSVLQSLQVKNAESIKKILLMDYIEEIAYETLGTDIFFSFLIVL